MEQQQRTKFRQWKATPKQKSTCSKSRLFPDSSECRFLQANNVTADVRSETIIAQAAFIHEGTTRWDSCEVQAKTKCVSKSAADLEVLPLPWICYGCAFPFAFVHIYSHLWGISRLDHRRCARSWCLTQVKILSTQQSQCGAVFFSCTFKDLRRSVLPLLTTQYYRPQYFAPIFANYNQHVSGALQCIKRSGKRRCNRSRRRSSRDLRHDTSAGICRD